MMQILFRLKPSWDLIRLTEEIPSVSILDWCNFNIDFYQIRSADQRELDAAANMLASLNKKAGFVLQNRKKMGTDSIVLVMKCKHILRGSVEETMNNFSCIALYPFVFQEGWMRVRAVGLEENRIAKMFSSLSKMGELKIENKSRIDRDSLRENFAIPTNALVANLTAKQVESLLVAAELGYYNVPRKITFEAIANAVNVPRTTYEEHVRKAESKIINAVVPYLSLFFGRSKNDGL